MGEAGVRKDAGMDTCAIVLPGVLADGPGQGGIEGVEQVPQGQAHQGHVVRGHHADGHYLTDAHAWRKHKRIDKHSTMEKEDSPTQMHAKWRSMETANTLKLE